MNKISYIAKNNYLSKRHQYDMLKKYYYNTNDYSKIIMGSLALSESISEDMQYWLSDHENENIQYLLGFNPAISKKIQYKLLEGPKKAKQALLHNINIDKDVLSILKSFNNIDGFHYKDLPNKRFIEVCGKFISVRCK